MRRLAVAACLVLALVAVGCGEAKLGKGTIVGKVDSPPYDSTWLMPIYAGQTCTKSGTSNICTPIYTYFPMVEHHAESWKFKIVSGSKKGVWYVSQDTFTQYQVGDDFDKSRIQTVAPVVIKTHEKAGG